MLLEFGIQTHIVGKCDSAAAKRIATRNGTGRLKHSELKQIWIQKYVRDNVHIQWLPSEANPSDGLKQTFTATDPWVEILAEEGYWNLAIPPVSAIFQLLPHRSVHH